MVFVDSATALAESQNNSAEFYASLPREKSLLCCVCQKHNTTFRYEVIYKSGPALGQKQPVNNNNSGKFYCFLFVACSTFLEFCLDSVYIFKWIEIESTVTMKWFVCRYYNIWLESVIHKNFKISY